VFLTQAHPKQTMGSDLHVGTSFDQVCAHEFGQDTAIPSMQLSIESIDYSGGCEYNYSCAYTDAISWASPSEPLPMLRDPRAVFDLMFGAGATPEERARRRREDRSILDTIVSSIDRLKTQLGASDRARLSQYLDDVREIERRIQNIEAFNRSGEHRELPTAPVGVPDSFDEHIKLMYDLQLLAYRADITRVSTMMYARDLSGATYPASGVRDGVHTASHHSNLPARMDTFAQINRYHVELLAYFLDKLKTTPDGDGTLLDHSVVLYGSSMSNGNQHDHDPLPILVAGGASGRLKGNRHIVTPAHTPMSNLMLSVLDTFGVHQDSFGDSTGMLEI
ncbi:MAG: DUF1552 domain-containing protein, partial [Vicinamibacterales bacterium]